MLLPELIIHDLDAYKALTHPLRIQVIELLLNGESTVKQLAQTLDVSQTKLYYHVNLLEKHGLIKVNRTTPVSGIMEKWYLPTAYHYRIDRSVLALSRSDEIELLEQAFAITLDETRRLIFAGVASEEIDLQPTAPAEKRLLLHRRLGYMSDEQIDQLHTQLETLLDEFGTTNPHDDDENVNGFGLTIALFPYHKPRGDQNDATTTDD